jgi:hypothetical protein
MTARIPITVPTPVLPVPLVALTVGVTVGALRTTTDPDDGSVVGADGAPGARGAFGVAVGTIGMDEGIGVGSGRSVGVGGASVAAIAVTPASAVSAAAVFVGPMVGACAATAGTALVSVAERTAIVPTVSTTTAAQTFIARIRGMRLSPMIHKPPHPASAYLRPRGMFRTRKRRPPRMVAHAYNPSRLKGSRDVGMIRVRYSYEDANNEREGRGGPMQTTSSQTPTPATTTDAHDPGVSADTEVGALTRLRLGTNTVQALIVNDKPIVALSDGGLYVDPRYARILTYVVARDTAYVVGTIEVNSVDIVISPDGITISGIGKIAGETLTELRLTIDESARVRVEAY